MVYAVFPHNTAYTKNHRKIVDVGTILNEFWGLGTTWGHPGATLEAQGFKHALQDLIFLDFCLQTGTPMGTRKSPLGAQGDHLSLQGCVLKGSFSGPPF